MNSIPKLLPFEIFIHKILVLVGLQAALVGIYLG